MSFRRLRFPGECSYIQNPGTTVPTDYRYSVYMPGLISNVYLLTPDTLDTVHSELPDISVSISSGKPTKMQGVNGFY